LFHVRRLRSISCQHESIFQSLCYRALISSLFLFTAPATTDIYTLSLHDALPISQQQKMVPFTQFAKDLASNNLPNYSADCWRRRSEEHTSELQSRENLVCRLLLEKKKKKN